MEDKVSAGGVELVLKEQTPRVGVVVRVDEAEHRHGGDGGCDEGKDGLLAEGGSEPMEERDRGRDKQERENRHDLSDGWPRDTAEVSKQEEKSDEKSGPTLAMMISAGWWHDKWSATGSSVKASKRN